MRCTVCHSAGHNRRSARCPLAENNRGQLFVITYFLFARRIRFGQQIVQVRLPQMFHHALVLDGREFGYGRHGITEVAAGLFYGRRGRWRVNTYIALPAQFQLGITLRQMRNIVGEQAIVQRFGRNSYCCIHNNCVSFTQELTAAILRHHHRQMPADLPFILQQYPVHLIERFLRAINEQLRNPIAIDHNDPHHQCIFIS